MMKTKFAGASFPSFLPSRRVARKSSTRNGRTNRTKAREALERAETHVQRQTVSEVKSARNILFEKRQKNRRARCEIRDLRWKKNNFNADCTRAPSPSFFLCLACDDDAFLFCALAFFDLLRPGPGDFFLERRVRLGVIVVVR